MGIEIGRASRRSARFLVATALTSGLGAAALAQAPADAPASPQPTQTTQPTLPMTPPGQPGTSPISGPQGAAAAAAGSQPAAPVAARPAERGLGEIVVTAQRREQRLQDVPIAITAINQASLQVNRVQSVQDLSGLAPSLVVRQAVGGLGIPSFSMRGITSYGVVPGSDKEISIYIDGVYLGSPRGSIFDLPDIERVEVLRGPQGTLFGRNATAGAMSVVTRDPTGNFGGRQEVSVGNYDYVRTRTTIDSPQFGPFSAYVTYTHSQRRGDIRNTGAGTVWDRSASSSTPGIQTSPKYLGNHNSDSVFFALKFEPSDNFNSVYKFDFNADRFTPEGVAVNAINPLLNPILSVFPGVTLESDFKRPKTVNNSWTTPGFLRVYGHSLTSNLQVTDNLSFKNIASYRKSFIRSNTQIDGLGGLVIPSATGGSTLAAIVTQNRSTDEQASDELQANFRSKLLTLTVGGLYFWQRSAVGGPEDMLNTTRFSIFTNNVIPLGNISRSRVRATSIAAYAQAELHVTDQLDVVGGVRVTRDHKEGNFQSSGPAVGGVITGLTTLPFDYKKTKPNYSIGVNYKATAGILLYGKYSTAFVSGGSIGGQAFDPETAKSWEIGFKGDLLDRRLRANISAYTVKYNSIQSAQSGSNFNRPDLSTLVVSIGDGRAKGVEVELTALPVRGVTLGASGGYQHIKYSNLTPQILTAYNGSYLPTLLAPWTTNLSAQYDTPALFGDAKMMFRVDANWRDRMRVLSPGQVATIPAIALGEFIPSAWIVNGRVALQKLRFGPLDGEVAIWTRNLTNNRAPTFPFAPGGFVLSTTYQSARTFGADLSVKF